MNPYHLKNGTAQDNSTDMTDKGRQKGLKHSKFSVSDLKAIINFHKKTNGTTNQNSHFFVGLVCDMHRNN